MARYNKTGIQTTVSQLNAEFEKIENSINELLSRLGDGPNQMETSFDMNSNRILNLPEPDSATEPVRLIDLQNAQIPTGGGGTPDPDPDPVEFPWFNIEDYGAVGDGVTPVNGPMQAAIADAQAAGGGVIFIPAGDFLRTNTVGGATATTWNVSSDNITIMGVGPASHIVFDDTLSDARSDLFNFTGDNLVLKDFRISGTARDFANTTSTKSQCITGDGCTNVRIHNVTLEALQYMAITITGATDVLVTGCRLEDIARDGYRFTAGRNVRIIGNYAKNVADDVVAIHSIDSTRTTENILVSENNFQHCQSMKFLGAKNLVVTNNTFDRGLRGGIYIANNETVEGNTNMFNIKICDNIFLNFFSNFGVNGIIKIIGRDVFTPSGSTYPGYRDVPFDENYTNNIDSAQVVMPIQKLEIRNNIFARTLPAVADYSTYGYGQFFDRVDASLANNTVSYFRNQAITDSSFNVYAIDIDAPCQDLTIDGNYFGGHRLAPIRIQHSDFGVGLDYQYVSIKSNIFKNTGTSSGSIILLEDNTSGTHPSSSHVMIDDNLFDGDPFFVSGDHNLSTNTWSGDDALTAIKQDPLPFLTSVVVNGNTFKNVSQTGILAGANVRVLEPNICHAEYTTAVSASNKGIRNLPEAYSNIYVRIQGDPSDISTFGQVVNFPETVAAASDFPLSGYWPYGHFIKNRAPQLLSDPTTGTYIVTGWVKLATNNNGAVDGSTGFAELRSFISNIS